MNFKWIRYIGCLALVISFATACKKDLGNYDYKDINELVIANIPDTMNLVIGQRFTVIPQLDFTKDTVTAHYTYQWACYDPRQVDAYTLRILDSTKTLDMDLPLTVGEYIIYYTVKEKATGISWRKKFIVIVTGTIKRRGWFVLSDVDAQSKLDYFEEDMAAPGTYVKEYRNLLGLIKDRVTGKPIEIKGKPKFLEAVTNTVLGVTGAKTWIYIGAELSGEKINVTDGFTWENPLYSIKSETATGEPALPSMVRGYAQQVYAFDNGEVHFSYPAQRYVWGIPISRLSGGVPFKVAPSFAMATGGVALFYDATNKRFVRHLYNTYLTTLTPKRFDPNNMDKDVVWMGWTSAFAGQAIAIMKDAADKRYLARMTFTTAGTFSADSLKEVNMTDLAGAENFVMDHQFGYLLYSKGSKLYRYNLDTEELQMIKDYGSGVQITMLKSRILQAPLWFQVEARPDLYNKVHLEPLILGITVAVYEPANPSTSGKLDVIKISGTPGVSYYTLTGFGKVVDAVYTNLN
ncbi:PKD-like family lipoprotein [Chitinophaga horti]|uniref:PKD-like family lipoprotein n=1 Tax=Chitinophaga horti TaxID=2920382 RepID=A0ABY6J373_9BACT|nr:PKD-like family lipoprotein [Chitinophaga horti]UYQ94118.1 PKD-like family lipoprotein [Chitinophaga horti]